MADERPRDARERPERKRDPGRPAEPEEVGATTGRTHDQVLDATLDEETARRAKLRRDRSGLLP